ncbi:hypothetical protein AQUCO_00100389v1 [Aquilegia coerulea]|uniref:F-box domain-containing protein n=1 Tax=Aquilegia coerulea TaxID=218851 RepID=A0A2G5FA52_AQUCA|nr:hypothetical protein AQUCO_00100389v1 [Aquilegia coerulea]
MATLLPEEIIADILSRVPTKSVMRFRCVCKPWCRLTSESTFIETHFNRSIEKQGYEKCENLNLFLASKPDFIMKNVKSTTTYTDGREDSFGDGTLNLTRTHMYSVVEDEAVEIENPLEPCFHETLVLGSCNGLICLYTWNRLCLLNPATREYKKFNFIGGFDSKNIIYGFGYSSVDDVYKVIYIVPKYDTDEDYNYSEFNIFPVSETTPPMSGHVGLKFLNKKESGILLNETLHWAVMDNYNDYARVFSFCLRDNVGKEVPRPNNVKKKAKISIGVLGGQLCLLSKFSTSDTEIWVMKNYGESNSWTKLFEIEGYFIPSIPISRPYSHYGITDKYLLNMKPLYFAKNGEVLITNGRDLVLYNPLWKGARNLEIHGITDQTNTGKVVTYIASLVTLKSGTYAREEKQADDKWRNLRVRIQQYGSTSAGSVDESISLVCDKP